ncbi:DnaJ-like subfamily C member 11 [Oopsacas minuta]|uniref:DnaJ-like subfamily C member 11 n=1 Tax=Oopsacas minuta TaxID=111878 RepID=A0AAV7K6S7_9METZ|nr:DnaJ-like subfamily C member 11 [Oopsacas minuta]
MASNFDEIRFGFEEGERVLPEQDSDPDNNTLSPRMEGRDGEYYSVLNVAREANEYELKQAFNQMVLRYHPDRYTDPVEKQTAQELFHKVREAYGVLRDPAKRAVYDTHGRKGLELNWTVAIRDPKLHEHEVFMRMREEINEIQSYSPSGVFSATLDLSKIERIQSTNGIDLTRAGQYIQTKNISIQENISTPLGPMTRLNLGGAVSLDEKGGTGQFTLGVAHTSSNGLFTRLSGSIGNWPSLRIQLRKQLFDRVNMNLIGMVRFAGPYFECIGVPTFTTRFGDKTHGSLQLHIGRSGFKIIPVISRQITTNLIVSAKLDTDPVNHSVRLECSYVPIKQYVITVGVKFALKSHKLKYSLQRSFSEHSSLCVSFSFEYPGGVSLKFSLTRYDHTFILPIRFSDSITIQKGLYAHLLPLALYGFSYALFYSPFFNWTRKKLNEDELRVKEQQYKKETSRQAEVNLMTEAYDRSHAYESEREGLIIREAWFGLLRSRSGMAEQLISEGLPCVLDVTIPLQCLVKDSKLELTDTSKVHLAGFYDVYKGEKKDLNVKYYFRGELHEVTVDDCHPLSIPKRSHQLRP